MVGGAVAEALAVKLAGLDTVTLLERQRIRAVTASRENVTPEMLGVDALVTGSVQLVGEWDDPASRLRVTVNLVMAESGQIQGQASHTADGTVGGVFQLEADVAHIIATRLGLEPTTLAMDYREEETPLAKRHFGEGLQFLEQAAALEEAAHAHAQEHRAPGLTDTDRAAILPVLELAIAKLREAEQQNGDVFYSRAHHYEGRARERLAALQADDAQAKAVREATVRQFRRDAADAASAFFDLGRALQANQEYEEAIEAYREYLRWVDETARPFLWEARWYNPMMIETGPGYFEHGTRRYDLDYTGYNRAIDYTRPFKIHDGDILYCASPTTLTCVDLLSGQARWTAPVENGENMGRTCTYCLVVRKERVYFASKTWVQIFDRQTGEEIRRFSARPDSIEWWKGKGSIIENHSTGPLSLYLFDKQDVLILQDEHGLSGHRISDGERIWVRRECSVFAFSVRDSKLYEGSAWLHGLHAIDPLKGTCAHDFFELTFAQMWPAKDHLLLRATENRSRPEDDAYYRYDLRTKTLSRCEGQFLFSHCYENLPAAQAKGFVPLVDEESGLYRPVPVRLFQALNSAYEGDDTRLGVREWFPWVTLKGSRLWGWKERTVYLYDVDTAELRWKKWIPGSHSGLDAEGDVVAVRMGNRFGVYRASHSPQFSRPVKAHTHIAQCQQSLDQSNGATASLAAALQLDPTDPDAHWALSQLQRRRGNVLEAIEIADSLLRTAPATDPNRKAALAWLGELQGLRAMRRIPPHRFDSADDAHAYIEMQRGNEKTLVRYSLPALDEPVTLFQTDAEAYWHRKDQIYFLDAGRVFPKTRYSFRGNPNTPDDATIQAILDAPEPESVVWRQAEGSAQREVLLRFRGFDNRFHDDLGYLQDDVFLVGLESRRLAAYSLEDREKLWERTMPGGYLTLLTDPERVYIAESRTAKRPFHNVCCLDLRTGETRWQRTLDITLRPGMDKVSREGSEVVFTQERSIPEVINHALIVDDASNELRVIPLFSREAVTHKKYWADPRPPLYRLDRLTGELRGRGEFDRRITGCSLRNSMPVLVGWMWTWASYILPDAPIVLDQHAFSQGDTASDFRVVEADFWERDPRLLAEFPPLADLADTWDLSVHVGRLNRILASPAKRRELIDMYRESLLAQRGGHEPGICWVQGLLQKGDLTEREEQFLVRQIMTLWKGYEPNTHMRQFHYPLAVRGRLPVFPKPQEGGAHRIIAEVGARLLLFDRADHNRRLTPLRWQPRLQVRIIPEMNLERGYLFVRTPDEHLMVYDADMLMHFITSTVQREEDLFGLSEAPLDLADAFDGDPETVCRAAGDADPISIGIDRALPCAVNRITVRAALGHEASLRGALLMGSDRSENGGATVLHRIAGGPARGEALIIRLDAPVSYRWYRLTLPPGRDLAVAELSFDFDAPLLEGRVAAADLQPGLRRALYRGTWKALPDFDALEADLVETVAGVSLDGVEARDEFGLRVDGYLRIERAGEYAFHLTSDDGSRLTLHDAVLIDNDGLHPMVTKSCRIRLTPGLHPIRIDFFEKGGGQGLTLEWTPPGAKRERIPGSHFGSR